MENKLICTRKFYLHGSKEYNWGEMEDMVQEGFFNGWSDVKKDDFREQFIYSLYEVELELQIYDDGTTKIVEVDGNKVVREQKQMPLFNQEN
jgi:hypothetical protein